MPKDFAQWLNDEKRMEDFRNHPDSRYFIVESYLYKELKDDIQLIEERYSIFWVNIQETFAKQCNGLRANLKSIGADASLKKSDKLQEANERLTRFYRQGRRTSNTL
jgi:hypothetical protein